MDDNKATATLVTEHQGLVKAGPNAMDLLQVALSKDAAIDVIERLAALQEKMVMREAEVAFGESLTSVQEEISSVVGDLTNADTGKKYASFKALNKAIRPIYLKHGFNLSFGCAESAKPEEVLVVCDCAHRGSHAKRYMIPMPCDGKGAKGGGVMSKTHATIAATTSGRNTLLRLIFNLAVTEVDENFVTNGELTEAIDSIEKAETKEAMMIAYGKAYAQFEETPAALKAVVAKRREVAAKFSKAEKAAVGVEVSFAKN